MPSVLNPWVQELTYMQQTVLLCAVRNHDGFNKHNPAKDITRYLRRVVLCSAFDGRMLADPHESGGGNFTGPLKHGSVYDAVTAFLDGRDEMSLHYWLHAVHAFEIVGYMCPEPNIARTFFDAYMRCVSAMHMEPESKYAMEQRLSDNPEKWLARSDAYERAAFHAEQTIERNAEIDYRGHSDIDDLTLQDAEDTLRKLAQQDERTRPGRSMNDPTCRSLTPEEEQTRRASLSSRSWFEAEDQPIPTIAAVKEGEFVNVNTGNALGYPFNLKWGARIDEFPVYTDFS